MRHLKHGMAIQKNKHNEYNKERRCDALLVIYSVDSGGKAWRTMLPWYDMKAKLICRRWGRWGRLNGFLHTQPVQYCPDCVLFISSCSHFSLIRHLPASGVFIIHRKLITYTRQPPTALVVITETAPHVWPMGENLRRLIFTRADGPDSCKNVLKSANRFQHIFLPGFVFTHLSCQT